MASARGQGLELGIRLKTDTTTILDNILTAKKLLHAKQTDSALILYQQALNQSQIIQYHRGIHNALLDMARIDYNKGHYQECIAKIDSVIANSQFYRSTEGLSQTYFIKGSALYCLQDYSKSISAFISAANHIQEPTHPFLGEIYNNLGEVFAIIGQGDKAISYFQKSIYSKSLGKNESIDITYLNLGKAYTSTGQYHKAQQAFDSAQWYAQDYGRDKNLPLIWSFRSALLIKQKQFSQALDLLQRTRDTIAQKSIAFPRDYLIDLFAGEAHEALGQYKAAEEDLLAAQRKVENVGMNDQAYIVHRLGELYYQTGDFKKAYDLHVSSHVLLDSIKSKEVQVTVNQLETQYRTAQKDKTLALQSLKLAEREKTIAKKNNQIMLFSFAGLLLLISSLAWFRSYRRKQTHRQEIARLKGSLEGEEKERNRLAHELHEGINSQIAAVQAHVSVSKQKHPVLATDPNILTTDQLLHDIAVNVRHIAHNLAPDQLQQRGLVRTLTDFCHHLFADSAVQTEINIYGSYEDLDSSHSLLLYRITQELASNVKKHAVAGHFTLLLYRSESIIRLTAEDDGKGFDPAAITESTHAGIGLTGIRDRLKSFNGSMEVRSAPGQGCTIHIEMPITNE